MKVTYGLCDEILYYLFCEESVFITFYTLYQSSSLKLVGTYLDILFFYLSKIISNKYRSSCELVHPGRTNNPSSNSLTFHVQSEFYDCSNCVRFFQGLYKKLTSISLLRFRVDHIFRSL